MDSDDSECNTEFNLMNMIFEAYLRFWFKMRWGAFLCLKKVII